VTSSLDVREGVCRDEVEDGGEGGRSGSTASAPGPGVDILRLLRFLRGQSVRGRGTFRCECSLC
jgi:hypothetical protein